jgi:RNA polymerase sigma-70 factor (ECF subfamily)
VASTPAELFERHHVAIYRYLLRMVGSPETAEELTQDVFVRVVKGIDSYQEIDRERAWLFRIARNLRCDHLRQRQRQPPSTPLDDVEPIEPQSQELQFSLARALAELGDDDREAFVLGEIVGFSYLEIGVICGTTPAAIRSRIYRARLALRDALDAPAFRERSFVRGTHA